MKTIDDVLGALQASLQQNPPVIPAQTPPVSRVDAVLAALQQQLGALTGAPAGRPRPEVLVRSHHSQRDRWSFLCPDQTCQQWTTFQTLVACRTGWFKHAAEKHDPAGFDWWPDDLFVQEALQPVCWPGSDSSGEDLLLTMIRDRDAVDRCGRPLTFGYCTVCADPVDRTHHKAISGRTCVRQAVCPKCNAQPGQECDRSTSDLAPVMYGKDNQACAHDERFPAAAAMDRARWDAGDMTLPARWLPAPAPTARKRKPSTGMQVTLVVDAAADHNDMWRSMVWEYNEIGRLRWTNGGKRAHIAFPTLDEATWAAAFIAEFYGVDKDLIRVDSNPGERPSQRSDFGWMVWYYAEQVLRNTTVDTPDEHVAWAAGVLCTDRSADVLPVKLKLDSFVQIAHGGTLGHGSGMAWECDRASWRLHRMGRPWKLVKKLRWAQVIKAIQGRVPAALRVEMQAAEAEVALFPHGSVEFRRAMSWSLDVAMEAWMAVRPDGLAPFVSLTNTELRGVAEQR